MPPWECVTCCCDYYMNLKFKENTPDGNIFFCDEYVHFKPRLITEIVLNCKPKKNFMPRRNSSVSQNLFLCDYDCVPVNKTQIL